MVVSAGGLDWRVGGLFTFLSFFRGSTPPSFLSSTKLSAPIFRSRAAVSGVSAVPSTSLTLAFAQALTKRRTARTRSSSSCRRTLSVFTLNLSSSPLNRAGPVSVSLVSPWPLHQNSPGISRSNPALAASVVEYYPIISTMPPPHPPPKKTHRPPPIRHHHPLPIPPSAPAPKIPRHRELTTPTPPSKPPQSSPGPHYTTSHSPHYTPSSPPRAHSP